jgi:hypothetical protein
MRVVVLLVRSENLVGVGFVHHQDVIEDLAPGRADHSLAFGSLSPKYKGGRPRTFTLPERREIEKIAKSGPAEHGLPFSTWSLAEPADFLVAEGVVETPATRAFGACSERRACRFHA